MNEYITIEKFCTCYKVEEQFITDLHDHGLVKLTVVEEVNCIAHDDLPHIERYARLYHDMGINVAGIDAISNLLEKIKQMQDEIQSLKNQLSLYK